MTTTTEAPEATATPVAADPAAVAAPDPTAGLSDRGAALAAARKTKLDALFQGKKYTILKEIHLEGDQRFQTPFGNKGMHGYALGLVEGQDPAEGVPWWENSDGRRFIVGASVLKVAAKEYGAVDLPTKPRAARDKKVKEPSPSDLAAQAITNAILTDS